MVPRSESSKPRRMQKTSEWIHCHQSHLGTSFSCFLLDPRGKLCPRRFHVKPPVHVAPLVFLTVGRRATRDFWNRVTGWFRAEPGKAEQTTEKKS